MARTIGNAPTYRGFQSLANLSQLRPDKLVPRAGLAPATHDSSDRRSTLELPRQN